MKYEIRSIGLWSFLKQCFFLSLIIGFIVGLFYAMFLGVMLNMSSRFDFLRATDENLAAVSFGVLLFIMPFGMAIFSCVFNTIFGVIAVVCYNGLTKLIGGLELNLVGVTDETNVPNSQRPVTGSAGDVSAPPPPPPFGGPTGIPPAPQAPRNPEPPASQYE